MALRILVISNHAASGSNPHADSFIRERIAGLRDQGAEVSLRPLVTPPFRGSHEGYLNGAVVVPTGGLRYLMTRLGNPRAACRYVARKLHRVVGDDWDLIHGHGCTRIPAAGIAAELARMTGKPYAFTTHGSDINRMDARAEPYFRQLFEGAAGVCYVSAALARTAESRGLTNENAAVTPNGIDSTVFNTSRPESPSDTPTTRSTGPRALFVGNLLEVKGADRLPAIASKLSRLPTPGVLRVIGGGPLLHQLREETAHLPVTILGSQDRMVVAREMAAADVLILPSRSEGWPCVVLEAQAVGTPVVAMDVGGTSEAVGDYGLALEEPFDANTFVKSFLGVIGAWSRQEIADRAQAFEWSVLADRELSFLRSAADIASIQGSHHD